MSSRTWIGLLIAAILVIAWGVAVSPKDVTHPFSQYPYLVTSTTSP